MNNPQLARLMVSNPNGAALHALETNEQRGIIAVCLNAIVTSIGSVLLAVHFNFPIAWSLRIIPSVILEFVFTVTAVYWTGRLFGGKGGFTNTASTIGLVSSYAIPVNFLFLITAILLCLGNPSKYPGYFDFLYASILLTALTAAIWGYRMLTGVIQHSFGLDYRSSVSVCIVASVLAGCLSFVTFNQGSIESDYRFIVDSRTHQPIGGISVTRVIRPRVAISAFNRQFLNADLRDLKYGATVETTNSIGLARFRSTRYLLWIFEDPVIEYYVNIDENGSVVDEGYTSMIQQTTLSKYRRDSSRITEWYLGKPDNPKP